VNISWSEMEQYLDSKGWNCSEEFVYWDPKSDDSHDLEEAYRIEKARENEDISNREHVRKL
jgi:hypothetical protein